MYLKPRISQCDAKARINEVRKWLYSLSSSDFKTLAKTVGLSVSGLYRFRSGEQQSIATESWIQIEATLKGEKETLKESAKEMVNE